MNLPKIILLCCIVFVIALLIYIIITKKDQIKNFVLKIDDKITKHNEKASNKNKDKEPQDEKEEQDETKTKPKTSKKTSNKTNAKTNAKDSKQDDNKEETNNKLKPSKAVEQIRPVLLAPNKENEERDIKLLEMSKQPQRLNSPTQKALDFKYGAKSISQNQNIPQFQQSVTTKPSIPRARTNTNSFISFQKDDDNFNPLKRDVNRQFEDIKNFIELPDNQATMKQKGVSYNGKTFNTVDKIDASIFNSPESHYVDYRNNPNINAQRTNSTILNNVNNAMSKNNLQFPNQNGNVMHTQTKYSRNTTNQYGMPSFNLTSQEMKQANNFNPDYTLSPEQENIDLNKLPNNLKKMIIQNILDRKDYDD